MSKNNPTDPRIEESLKRFEKFIEDYIYLEDTPSHRKLFSDDTWYPDKTKSGRERDPLRTVVTHVGIDQLRKIFKQELQRVADESRKEAVEIIRKNMYERIDTKGIKYIHEEKLNRIEAELAKPRGGRNTI